MLYVKGAGVKVYSVLFEGCWSKGVQCVLSMKGAGVHVAG